MVAGKEGERGRTESEREGGDRVSISRDELTVMPGSRYSRVVSMISTAALSAFSTATPSSEAAVLRAKTASKDSFPSRMVSLIVGMVTEAVLDPRSNENLSCPP